MVRGITILLFISLLFGLSSLFAQDDAGENSIFGVDRMYGITAEEESALQEQVNLNRNVPAFLEEQLKQAQENNDIQEAERIENIINTQYQDGVRILEGQPDQNAVPDIEKVGQVVTPEWVGNDALVHDYQTANYQRRTLDLKYGDDGAIYLAAIVSQDTDRRIRVYKSMDGGSSWTYSGGIVYPSNNNYFQTISMLVEVKGTTSDSTYVIVYYTASNGTNNDNAFMGYFKYRPNTPGDPGYVIENIDTPTSGREFNYVSAISDGQFWGSATWIGCVVGEYSNNNDTTASLRFYRSQNWGDTHTGVTLATTWDDRYPVAQFKNDATDSVYIVTERRFTTTTGTRITVTPWTPTAAWNTIFVTSGGNYTQPVLSIKQQNPSTSMVITVMDSGRAVYHRSTNGGGTWDLGFTLDQRNPKPNTTDFTFVSSDTTGSSGDFTAVFGNIDSINVRRGTNGSLGSTTYMENSNDLTGTNPAVCAIYRDGGNLYSAFAYWAFGPNRVYFDGEDLTFVGVEPVNGPVTDYQLNQNYPNPFNPSTNIKFSIPENGNVKLVVYDILGNEVTTLVNENMQKGSYEVDFNAKGLTSGVYVYKITAGNFVNTKKMILLK